MRDFCLPKGLSSFAVWCWRCLLSSPKRAIISVHVMDTHTSLSYHYTSPSYNHTNLVYHHAFLACHHFWRVIIQIGFHRIIAAIFIVLAYMWWLIIIRFWRITIPFWRFISHFWHIEFIQPRNFLSENWIHFSNWCRRCWIFGLRWLYWWIRAMLDETFLLPFFFFLHLHLPDWFFALLSQSWVLSLLAAIFAFTGFCDLDSSGRLEWLIFIVFVHRD